MDLADIFSGSLTPAKWRALGEHLQNSGITTGNGLLFRKVGGKMVISARRSRLAGGGGTLPPLWPTLITGGTTEAPTYTVTISHGMINERVPGEGEALIPQPIMDLLWGDDAPEGKTATDLREFGITVGQQISVVVYVTETGLLGGDEAPDDFVAALVIEDEDTESVHYAPPCGDDADGSPGTYHYKIAVLRAADGTHASPWIEPFLAGSHISHFRELPLIDNYASGAATDLGRVVGKYDFTLNKYLFRGTSAQYGIASEEAADTISFSFDGTNVGGGLNILMLPEGEPPFANEPAKHRTIRELLSTDPDFGTGPQLRLSYADGDGSAPGANDSILARGNSKNFNLIFQTDDESPVELDRVNFEDGFGTEVDDVIITIPTPDELPDGSQGDMLYWNVVEGVGSWTLLANPGAPTGDDLKVLTHDGTIPVWVDFLALVIDICDGGTPTTATIYKKAP